MLERENKIHRFGSRESLLRGVLDLICAFCLHQCMAFRQECDLLSYCAVLVLA